MVRGRHEQSQASAESASDPALPEINLIPTSWPAVACSYQQGVGGASLFFFLNHNLSRGMNFGNLVVRKRGRPFCSSPDFCPALLHSFLERRRITPYIMYLCYTSAVDTPPALPLVTVRALTGIYRIQAKISIFFLCEMRRLRGLGSVSSRPESDVESPSLLDAGGDFLFINKWHRFMCMQTLTQRTCEKQGTGVLCEAGSY